MGLETDVLPSRGLEKGAREEAEENQDVLYNVHFNASSSEGQVLGSML